MKLPIKIFKMTIVTHWSYYYISFHTFCVLTVLDGILYFCPSQCWKVNGVILLWNVKLDSKLYVHTKFNPGMFLYISVDNSIYTSQLVSIWTDVELKLRFPLLFTLTCCIVHSYLSRLVKLLIGMVDRISPILLYLILHIGPCLELNQCNYYCIWVYKHYLGNKRYTYYILDL